MLGVAAIAMLGRMPAARMDECAPSYLWLLASVAAIVRGDRQVRRLMLLGMAGFSTFNLLWTGLTLPLSGPRYRLGDAAIGLFGLFGATGRSPPSARAAGTTPDTGTATGLGNTHPRRERLGDRMAAVIAGITLLDVGIQAQHITNQSILLAAYPNATARVTTAYMSGDVLAAAIGSALASGLYPAVG